MKVIINGYSRSLQFILLNISKKSSRELQKNEANDEIEIAKERYISPEKRQQIIDDLRLIWQYNNMTMEYQKIANLLYNASNQRSKFRTKNWVEINDDSRGKYNTNRQIKFKTAILKSSL